MAKCDNTECAKEAIKPSSKAFERKTDVPNVFSYQPYLGGERHDVTRQSMKYFCSPKCLSGYLQDKGIV